MKVSTYIHKYYKYVVFFVCLVLFYFLLTVYFRNGLAIFDDTMYSFLSSFQSPIFTWIMKFFTTFCSILVLVLLIIALFFFMKEKKYIVYIGINLGCVYILNTVIKFIVQRPRPEGIRLIKETGFSFPSGHAMISTAFYGYILYLIYHSSLSKKVKWFGIVGFSLLTFLIGISRIYLGVHFASDVLAGFALGTAYLILFIAFFYEKDNKDKRPK